MMKKERVAILMVTLSLAHPSSFRSHRQLAKAYEALVPFPMDLGTLHLRLASKQHYRTVRAFHTDVELFFCGQERLLYGQGARAGGGPGVRRPHVLAQLRHLSAYYRWLYLELVVGEGEQWRVEARRARDRERAQRLVALGVTVVDKADAVALLQGAVVEARAAGGDGQADAVGVARFEALLQTVVLSSSPQPPFSAEGEVAPVTVGGLWDVLETGMAAASPARQRLERGLHLVTAGMRERALRGSGACRCLQQSCV